MDKKKNINIFFYTFFPLALLGVLFFTCLNTAGADTFGGTILCTNSTINQYLILNSQNTCPASFTLSPSDFDLTNYDPVTDYSLYLGGSGSNTQTGTATGTNIPITTQKDLQTNTQPIIEDREVIINFDPSLATGPFINLDPTDYPYCVSLSYDLSYGANDSKTKGDVSALQEYLTDRGFLETGATGFYGRATETAVKRFEYRNQIEVNGVVRRDFRDILKELTCEKVQRVTYVDKPISPSKKKTSAVVSTVKKTVIPATKVSTPSSASKTVIPSTNVNIAKPVSNYVSITPNKVNPNPISTPVLDNTRLSSPYGVFSITNRNSLYFTFNTTSPSPTICINISGTDCSLAQNNTILKEGVNGNLYEAVNLSGKWSFTIYNNSSWGGAGSRANIYLRDSATSNSISIYTISVAN